MVNTNIFRLAVILSSGQAQTFKTNLKKLVKLVLFDNFGEAITLFNVAKDIESKYSLQFSDNELISSIKDDPGIIVTYDKSTTDKFYSLSPDEYKKIEEKQTVNIDDYIKQFISFSENEIDKDFNNIKELIYKFLYFSFNSDTKTVLELMNQKNSDTNQYCVNKEFTPDEAKIINAFLNWDYAPKNEFILNLISACFDYCMLTVKKDNNAYSSIFNGKEFYLDSNIIFRLAGFNKTERQESIYAFVKKCSDANIKLCYTNQTNLEIQTTINYYVDKLKELLGKRSPISTNAIRLLSSKYANLDFYDLYFEWCKSSTGVIGNFDAFKKHLIKIVSTITSSFKLVAFDNYDTYKNHNYFNDLCNDFTSYKLEHYKNTYEGAIKVDINNYLYINDKAEVTSLSDFMQMKYFFITADHCLTEWATSRKPGVVPIFVLPSVWYSILLKYKGRTEEDYSAFCQFLNIRIAPERDQQLKQKQKMLAYILNLDESQDLKEEIIFDISERLSDVHTVVDDPETFAEESHQTILQSKITETLEKANNSYFQEIEKLKIENTLETEAKINSLKESHKKNLDIAIETSFEEGKNSIINMQAEKIANRNKCIVVIFWISIVVSVFVFIFALIFKLTKGSFKLDGAFVDWCTKNETLITSISVLYSIISIAIEKILKYTGILSTDIEVVKQKLIKKYGK